MSNAAQVDLSVDQGADFAIQIHWTDAGNNPFTILPPMRMEIKANTGQVLHTLTTGVYDESGLDESNLLYNSESGLLQIRLTSEQTANFPSGSHRYDLFVTYQDDAVSGSTKLVRLIQGQVHVHGRVTTGV